MEKKISNKVIYVGVDDLDIDLFEGQYVVPEGMSYNSYLVKDGKTVVMDTVDSRKSKEWLAKLSSALDGRTPDYLVCLHMEPDHSGSVTAFMEVYPECRLLCSAQAVKFLGQFFPAMDFSDRIDVIKEGDEISLGSETLCFFSAPMVHWPEVMVTYARESGILFSADGFGKFGALCNETDDWACEARRYYFNICGKYGAQVQTLLAKAAKLDIGIICPLHGPVLKENLSYYIGLYDTWSAYRSETEGVFIAYTSLHGHTAAAAELLASELTSKGVKVAISDLCRCDMAEAVEDAFRYDRMVLAAPTYDGGLHLVMADFLAHLKAKGYRNRTVAIIENGTWAPCAGRIMRATLEEMTDIRICDRMVTLRSAMTDANVGDIKALAAELQ